MKKIGQGALGQIYVEGDMIYKYISNMSMIETIQNIKKLNDMINQVYPICGIDNIYKDESKIIVTKKYIDGNTLDWTLNNVSNPYKYLEKMVNLQLEINNVKINLPRKYSDKLKECLCKLEISNKDLIAKRIDKIEENFLCHGDFHPQNIIVKDEMLVAIDWDNAVTGHPFLDVARTYLLFETHSKGVGKIYLDMYCDKAKIDKENIMDYVPFIALEFLTEKANSGDKSFLLTLVNKLY